jgi:long-chain acyl-CoA synthetase
MLVHQFLEEAARRTPDAVALIETEITTSYSELDWLANRFAQLFVRAGVTPADRVVVALDNSRHMVAAYFGALKAGAVAVLLPAVIDCLPRLAIVDAATARSPMQADALGRVPTVFVTKGPGGGPPATPGQHDLESALQPCGDQPPDVPVAEHELAAIIYTSGSTGEPRGVMLSHRNFVENARSIIDYLALTAADRVMCVLPFHYVYGLSLLHTHLAVGGSIVIDNRFAYPNVVLAAMQQQRVTFALLLHRSDLDKTSLPNLRYVTQAGGGMPPARILEWLERGPQVPFFVMYGATEAAARLTYLPPAHLRTKLGSIGRSIPNVEIQVITDGGAVAQPGEVDTGTGPRKRASVSDPTATEPATSVTRMLTAICIWWAASTTCSRWERIGWA